MALVLAKHHGAGNDFLVQVDPGNRRPLSPAEVAVLCARRTGVGADGVLRVLAGDGDAALSMELTNADGSPAAMSGNGIRCLVQAAVLAGLVPAGTVTVATASGLRTVEFTAGASPADGWASVDMGPVRLGDEVAPGDLATTLAGDGHGDVPAVARQVAAALGAVTVARRAEVGNEHLVLIGPPVDPAHVASVGPLLEPVAAGGANVEFCWLGPGTDHLGLRVWERGAGQTLACGTGSCAAAAVAAAAGLVGDEVTVHNPGGPLTVHLGARGARLGGPVRKVADVTVDEAALAAAVAEGAAR